MSASCTQWRGDIGAYVVGALDHRADGRVTRHLANCRGCRADYDELVQVRDCLNRLDLSTAEPDAALGEHPEQSLRDRFHTGTVPASRPDPALLPRSCRGSSAQAPSRPTGRWRRIQPRTRRWLPAAAVALAAAPTAVAVLVSSGASARSYGAADGATGITGHAQLHQTPTGTQIDLSASGLPRDQRCILVAVANGGTNIAGSWVATYSGSARITGTTAFPASRLTALRIESDTGTLLLSIRL
jgi:Putative zinc-finger